MATDDDDAPGKPDPQRAPTADAPAQRDSRPELPEPKSVRAESPRDRSPEPRPEPRPPEPRYSDPLPKEDKLTETIRQRLEHLVPELVKKTFSAGMGAVFQTEEGIRKIAREVSLPDVVGYMASSADGAKDKVFEVIARETRDFLSTLNLTEEIAKILTTLSFEIKTEVRFIPNSERFGGAEPDVKASVKLKRNDRDKDRDKDREKDKEEDRDSRSRLRFWRRDGGDPSDGGNSGEE